MPFTNTHRMRSAFLSNTKNLFFERGLHFFLVLVAVMIMLSSSLGSDKGIYYWDIICVLAVFLLPWQRYVDSTAKWLIAWGFSFGALLIFSKGAYTGSSIILYFIAPIILYAFGGWFVDKLRGNKEAIYTFLFFSILFSTIAILYMTMVDVHQNGLISLNRIILIIDEKARRSATLFGMYLSIGMVGIPAFFFSYKPWKSLQSCLFLVIGVMSIVGTIHLLNRTGLVVLALCSITVLIYKSDAKLSKLLFYSAIVAFAAYVALRQIVPQDVFDMYALRNQGASSISSGGGRFYRWSDAITRVFYMPFGWSGKEYLTGYSYVHNWWLDVGRQTGIVPFVCLVVPTVMSIKTLFKLAKVKDDKTIALLVGLNTCLFFACMVEPVMEGSAFIAFFYCFIWGVQQRYSCYVC